MISTLIMVLALVSGRTGKQARRHEKTHYYRRNQPIQFIALKSGVIITIAEVFETIAQNPVKRNDSLRQVRPFKILAGNKIKARRVSNTPSTAIPTRRNGNDNSQHNGYKIMAISASGQQKMNSNSQSKRVIMVQALGLNMEG
jgi:hypothetical protein